MVNFQQINNALSLDLVREWLPDGEKQGNEWVSVNPTRADQSPGSFKVNLNTGLWKDFATGDAGGDLVSLWAYLHGLKQEQAAIELVDRYRLGINTTTTSQPSPRNTASKPATQKRKDTKGRLVMPVPADAPAPPLKHPRQGNPVKHWEYRNAEGQRLFVIARYDIKGTTSNNGKPKKDFRPLTCWQQADKPVQWHYSGLPDGIPVPLYGLDRLAARPEASVIVCEGEKAADAAEQLLADVVAICWAGGSSAVNKADWSALQGRSVIIWPDHDEPGTKAASQVQQKLQGIARNIRTIQPPASKPSTWDAADATPEEARQLVDGCKPVTPVPLGYRCDKQGVFLLDDDKPDEQLTLGACRVLAKTRDTNSENWGVLVEWVNSDGHTRSQAIPRRLFHAQGTELAQLLADGGLDIIPGKEKKLLTYLARYQPGERLTAATCTGWHGVSFVLPSETIRCPEGEQLVYQPETQTDQAKAINKKGSLENWKAGIQDASPVVRFLVCASLSTPARFLLGVEAGGFHIFNETSRGKTTALQVAASVWGNGTDPAIGGGATTYINRWNATANALEALAELHNDLPMIVDEVGEGDAKDFGRTLYRIMSGQGRSRSGKSGNLRASKSWRVSVLSAGELAVSDFLQSGGSQIKGGQLVRMIDIELDALPALFPDGLSADHFKRLCGEHYGHAGPALLARVPDLSAGWKALDLEQIGPATSEIAQRVRKRFAIVLHVGYLAAQAQVIPWTPADILAAVQQVYSVWHGQSRTVSDVERGVQSVIDFILANAARFETEQQTQEGHPPHNRAGWIKGGYYCFTAQAFKEACQGSDPKKIKNAIKDLGYLRHAPDRLDDRQRFGAVNTRCTSVSADIFSGLPKITGNSGNTGNSPEKSMGYTCSQFGNGMGTTGNTGNRVVTDATLVPTVPNGSREWEQAASPVSMRAVPTVPSVPNEKQLPVKNWEEF
jgi:putative DNA primase/helicase